MLPGGYFSMSKFARALVVGLLLLTSAFTGCKKETTEQTPEPSTFAFTVYPGARYLAQLTEVAKQAHKILKPAEEPPPIAYYDVDAPLDSVANFYGKSYGYTVAADATNNLSAAKPPAYYRGGDLQSDVKAIEDLLKKLKLNTDISKAQGKYRAVEIEGKPNRPRVTIQRPYFDVTKSQVVDRTIILMAP
jgi:hypothetical protein